MPRSAIETGLADYVLPPEKMGKHLIEYAKRATYRVAPGDFPKDGEVPDAMQKIYILLRAQTGHDFSLYKPNTVWRRIERRMDVHQLDHVSSYVRYLQENPREVETLFKELLIGVTRFFRDPEAFQILKEKIFPGYLRDKPDNDSIRVWVPGCSSGEEAYSVAMIMSECMETLDRHFNVQIFATDIDADAIAIARVGIYPESIAADVNADRLRRFFLKGGWHLPRQKERPGNAGFCSPRHHQRPALHKAGSGLLQESPHLPRIGIAEKALTPLSLQPETEGHSFFGLFRDHRGIRGSLLPRQTGSGRSSPEKIPHWRPNSHGIFPLASRQKRPLRFISGEAAKPAFASWLRAF